MPQKILVHSPLELTTILIRHHGIHRGLWSLVLNFNVQGHIFQPDINNPAAFPSALLVAQQIGLQEVEVADRLTVDAAAVNPEPTLQKRPHSKRRNTTAIDASSTKPRSSGQKAAKSEDRLRPVTVIAHR